MEHIDGQWKLAMTDDGDILAIIETVQALPLVTVGDITQSVDVQKETVKNTVQLAAPMPFELSANVQWLMQRPRNVYQTFANRDKSTHVSTPHLLEGLHTAALALGDDMAALASFSTLVQQLQDAITSYGSTAGSGMIFSHAKLSSFTSNKMDSLKLRLLKARMLIHISFSPKFPRKLMQALTKDGSIRSHPLQHELLEDPITQLSCLQEK